MYWYGSTAQGCRVTTQQSVNIWPENWVKIFPGTQNQHKNNKKGNMPETELYVTTLNTNIWLQAYVILQVWRSPSPCTYAENPLSHFTSSLGSQTTNPSANLNIYPNTLTKSILSLLKLKSFTERVILQRTINISK